MSLFLPYVISSYVFSNLAKAVDGLGGSAVGVVFISEGIVDDGWCVMRVWWCCCHFFGWSISAMNRKIHFKEPCLNPFLAQPFLTRPPVD